jgi:putative membrane protein
MVAKISRRSAFVRILRVELHFFLHYPRMLLAAGVVILIPALYALIYLASVWDPASKTGALAVGLVNLDEGLVYRQQALNVGQDVIERIQRKPAFAYRMLDDEATARAQVEAGQLAFALIVPVDFSFNAIPGSQPGAGRLVVFSSEGNNYTSANLARHFAEDLGREVNQSLNEQRWSLVLAEASGSQRSLQRLHEGVTQLQTGANDLAVGAGQVAAGASSLAQGSEALDQGVDALVEGTRGLSAGLRAMHAQRPRNAELRALDEGSRALLEGQKNMIDGLGRVQTGVDALGGGVTGFKAQAADSSLTPQSVTDALAQLDAGVRGLDGGTRALAQGQQQLLDGAVQLEAGVHKLTGGARQAKAALGDVVKRLPADERLQSLSQGSEQLKTSAAKLQVGTKGLAEGARHVQGGLQLLAQALPASLTSIEGNAEGLANSVRPVIELAAPVHNNGGGFAPNIIPGALWLGASLVAFLFHLRALPRGANLAGPWAKMGGKIFLPIMLVGAQAAVVWLCLHQLLDLHIADRLGLVSTLMVASVTFVLLVYALTRVLGDVGKALAMILLAVQLSSSGSLMPVELSGGVFALISPYLPITWVVTALKASLFGAFNGLWQPELHKLLMVAVGSAIIATYLGRWRHVPTSSLRPHLDL